MVLPHWRGVLINTGKLKMAKSKTNMRMAFMLCVIFYIGQASAQGADRIRWSITPYIWAAQANVDLKVRDITIGGGEISFSDLVDKIDAAVMVNVEGGRGNWSVLADLTYFDIADTAERTPFDINARIQQTFLDVAAAYWPQGFGTQLSIIGGLRYSSFDNRFSFSSGNVSVAERGQSNDYADVLVGLRYRFDLSDRWAILTSGDASFGASEGTVKLRANLAWTVGKRKANRVLLGYQYWQGEFKDGDILATDFTYHGPMAGFNFRF